MPPNAALSRMGATCAVGSFWAEWVETPRIKCLDHPPGRRGLFLRRRDAPRLDGERRPADEVGLLPARARASTARVLESSLTSKIPFLKIVASAADADVVATLTSVPAENGTRFKLDFVGKSLDGYPTEVHSTDKIPSSIDSTTATVRILTKLERGLDDFMDQKLVRRGQGRERSTSRSSIRRACPSRGAPSRAA